jgi:hypothetical protein
MVVTKFASPDSLCGDALRRDGFLQCRRSDRDIGHLPHQNELAGAPLPGYENVHAGIDAMIESVAGVPKSNPMLGMDVLVDVVRGDGRTTGRKQLPLWLFLGEDCMRDVSARLNNMGSIMDEWEAVGTRINWPPGSFVMSDSTKDESNLYV